MQIDLNNITSLNSYTFYNMLCEENKEIKINKILTNITKTKLGLLLIDIDVESFIKNTILLLKKIKLIKVEDKIITISKKETEVNFKYLMYENKEIIKDSNLFKEIEIFVKKDKEKKKIKKEGKRKYPPSNIKKKKPKLF